METRKKHEYKWRISIEKNEIERTNPITRKNGTNAEQ